MEQQIDFSPPIFQSLQTLRTAKDISPHKLLVRRRALMLHTLRVQQKVETFVVLRVSPDSQEISVADPYWQLVDVQQIFGYLRLHVNQILVLVHVFDDFNVLAGFFPYFSELDFEQHLGDVARWHFGDAFADYDH
jgi:hypothetical protein